MNAQNIARDAAVPRSSVDGYITILHDTLLAHALPTYRPGLKVREAAHPKFYWGDVGVARAAAGWLRDPVDRTRKGHALETLVFHELRVFNAVSGRHRPIAYYRTPAGAEIDFMVETRKRQTGVPPEVVCIEVKRSNRWNRAWERAMRSLRGQKGVKVGKMIGVYTGEKAYHFDGLDVWPIREFLRCLHAGDVF